MKSENRWNILNCNGIRQSSYWSHGMWFLSEPAISEGRRGIIRAYWMVVTSCNTGAFTVPNGAAPKHECWQKKDNEIHIP